MENLAGRTLWKCPVPSVMPSLSPSPFGSRCLSDRVARDRPNDVTQDFIGLSLANTTRSWRGLWITLHRSLANMELHF